MSDHAWFRLLVRALGVLFLGLAAPQLLRLLTSVFMFEVSRKGGTAGTEWDVLLNSLPTLLGYGAQVAIGYYLLFRGQVLVEYCIRDLRGRCAACGYDLIAITGPDCPECGAPIRRSATSQPPSMP